MHEVQYVDNGEIAIFDGMSFRRDKRTGYYLARSAKDGDRRKRLHVYVWEHYNGAIPDGYHVHHIDHDKNNNEISNLKMLTSEEHHRLHMIELTDEQKERKRKNVVEKAMPKAKEWHKSDEGREWHRQNAIKQWENRNAISYQCTNCGEEFESRRIYSKDSNRFCCGACKAAYRRKNQS